MVVKAVLFVAVAAVVWFNAHRVVMGIFRLQLKFSKELEKELMTYSELTFDFDNGLISDISEREELRVRFENVTAVYEAEKAFYVYFGSMKAFVIPYTSFKNADEFYAFQRLLRSCFAKNG